MPPPTSAIVPASATVSSLGRVVYEKCVEGQTVRQDVVADVVAPDTQRVQLHGVFVLHGHLDSLQVGVHAHVNTYKMRIR